MEHIETLRQYVRMTLRQLKSKQKEELRLENQNVRRLRKEIRKVLREKQDTTQHNSTGLNALEKLLNSIVPILEVGYKDLKTDVAQRTSFKAHIVRGIQNLLSTADLFSKVDNGEENTNELPTPEPEQQLEEDDGVDVKLTPEKNPKFIDIEKDKKDKEQQQQSDPMNAFQPVEGEDLTGRNFALETFKKIQKQILETFSLLSNEQDKDVFYKYLITNVKLYFDKFETELEATPEEPTTPEYEAEKAKLDAELQAAAPPTGGELPPAPEEAPPPEA